MCQTLLTYNKLKKRRRKEKINSSYRHLKLQLHVSNFRLRAENREAGGLIGRESTLIGNHLARPRSFAPFLTWKD